METEKMWNISAQFTSSNVFLKSKNSPPNQCKSSVRKTEQWKYQVYPISTESLPKEPTRRKNDIVQNRRHRNDLISKRYEFNGPKNSENPRRPPLQRCQIEGFLPKIQKRKKKEYDA